MVFEKINMKIQEQINLLIYDMAGMEYKPVSSFYKSNQEGDTIINMYPHFQIKKKSVQIPVYNSCQSLYIEPSD